MRLSDEFINIRRTALVLSPQKPFYDWVKSVSPSAGGDIGPFGGPEVYLLPDFETTDEMEAWLRKNYDWFFCEHLNNWFVDEDLWVKDRTFSMFKEWFDYSLHTMVWDSLDGPIQKLE